MAGKGDKRFTELIELSARLGSQPLLVQASTGNTSIKIGPTLWIKASGKWLGRAAKDEMFVPVNLADVTDFLSATQSTPARFNYSALTPSIETAMHLVLPHRVVIHLHSVNTITWAVQRDGFSRVAQLLRGLRWTWIKYTFSGAPLARSIQASLDLSPNVFVLGNHGLVIGGDSCHEVSRLLSDLENRLAVEPRQLVEPNVRVLAGLAAAIDYEPAKSDVIHSLATDCISIETVSGGVLYPCQAMFLGRSTCFSSSFEAMGPTMTAFLARNKCRPPAIFVRGAGVLVAKDITVAEAEMLLGLAEVARRVPTSARIRYLTEAQTDEVLTNSVYAGVQPRPSSKLSTPQLRPEAASK